jgi:SAM-dependent methyltransferase
MEATIRRLKEQTEARRSQFRDGFARFADRHGLKDWEGWFSPYDDEVYDAVLSHVTREDVVLDIGAGDLRLALRLTERAQKVYAVEVNPLVVARALDTIGLDLPRNLHVICGNALDLRIPADVTIAVLLMRHCQHFAVYFDRLQAAGCRRLLTNARWRSNVEAIDLTVPGLAFEDLREGWYACRCGATGYVGTGTKPDAVPVEVVGCPACSTRRSAV